MYTMNVFEKLLLVSVMTGLSFMRASLLQAKAPMLTLQITVNLLGTDLPPRFLKRMGMVSTLHTCIAKVSIPVTAWLSGSALMAIIGINRNR